MPDFVFVEALEYIAAQTKPGAVGIVRVHHVPPYFDRKLETRLFFPRNRRHLHRFVFGGIKDGAAEHQAQMHISVTETVKILGRTDVEVKGAGDRKVHRRLPLKRRNVYIDMSPEQVAQRLTPTVGLAEEVA